jgi:hypothetical protein
VLAAVAPAVPLIAVRSNTDALIDMFTTGTLMPAITYTGTVLLYTAVASRLRPEPSHFHLGRWQRLVVIGALVWLAYELIVLLGPELFRAAQGYALIAVMVGVIVFGLMWLLEPRAPDEPPTEQERGYAYTACRPRAGRRRRGAARIALATRRRCPRGQPSAAPVVAESGRTRHRPGSLPGRPVRVHGRRR